MQYKAMTYLLVDNGSLRPESVLNLRRLARMLSERSGCTVEPASLLHSSKIDAERLEGIPAVNFERRLRLGLEAGERAFTVIPFFFGPTAAVTDYMADRIAYRRAKHGDFSISRTSFLAGEVDQPDTGYLVEILADRVREAMRDRGWNHPRVALVDHGSPKREVTRIRDLLATKLETVLGDEASGVCATSMERRPGPEFAFNEPLLETLLRQEGWCNREVIVAMQFLSPGRHAGPSGDVAKICEAAGLEHPKLQTAMTALMGTHPFILELLLGRLNGPRYAL